MVKPELVEMYKSLCKRGRKKQRVMELMSEAIKTKEILLLFIKSILLRLKWMINQMMMTSFHFSERSKKVMKGGIHGR